MIDFQHVSLTYADATAPVLRDVTLRIDEGELCLVTGRTGSGKSTLLGAINGLVPHFTGGRLAGRVIVDGRDTATHPPRELADVVGMVGQDPLATFVTDTVEEELAYSMEQLAVPPDVMRKRVEETLDLLGLADLRHAALVEISGGQQQRVAIGAVLTAHPRILVLDEPTSALDPTAAEEVLAAITRLVHDLGVTVVMAEHRLERVVQYADRVLHLDGDGTVAMGAPAAMFETTSVAPPVVELGRLAGWTPLPLSVRDARRHAGRLREQLRGHPVPAARSTVRAEITGPSVDRARANPIALTARGVVVQYGQVVAVRGVDLDLRAGRGHRADGAKRIGQVVPAVGLAGFRTTPGRPGRGGRRGPQSRLAGAGSRPSRAGAADTGRSALSGRVRAELAQADRESGPGPTSARALFERLAPGVADDLHPRDLSEGQRLALVLAVQLRAAPRVLLLDEPTRGLDYPGKAELRAILDDLAAEGCAVVVSTHDVEFVAAAADRVIVLADGDIVADGLTADVIVASPSFAPQVAKILAPLPYLTVAQVAATLQAGAAVDRHGILRARGDRRRRPLARPGRATVASRARAPSPPWPWRRSSGSSRSCGRSSLPQADSVTPTPRR